LKLILLTRKSDATDPRDHIFAIIGLADDVERMEDRNIQPNYQLSTEEIFTRVATWALIKQKDMAVLSYTTDRSESGLNYPLPSWVPNFASLRKTCPLNHSLFNSSKASVSDVRLSGDSVSGEVALHLYGKQVDTVLHLGNATCSQFLPPETMDDISQLEFNRQCNRIWLQQCRDIARKARPSATQDDFWRTMICDCATLNSDRAAPEYGHAFEKYAELYSEEFDQIDFEENPSSYAELLKGNQLIQPSLINNLMGRLFCCTSGGRLGQMPMKVQLGDWICVLHGANVPYVLHPVDDEQFKLVGDCYLHGIMDGEAMDMPALKTREFVIV